MPKPVRMNLVGLDGNAFSLMGAFIRNAERQGWTEEEIKSVIDQCRIGDYDNLLRVLMANTTETEDDDE